jgi:2',3'-cyclic-nucleotide 2'-phosphodiesterase (5'-nucleotidase family)
MKNTTFAPSRRTFLKKSAILSIGSAFINWSAHEIQATPKKDAKKITILYTADIHGQLFTHDEFFWENGKPVYRKRGGLAVLKTMVDHFRKENPNTILIDGGDYFHGSALASLTEGKALIPVMNALQYDLIIPGNWEVVYKKEKMLYDMGHVNAAKICANMWHKTDDNNNGELIFQPYWIRYINGIKIGFIGYTDPLIPKRQAPAYSKGIRFAHPEGNVARYVKFLKEEEGCSLVFIVTHMGLAQQVSLCDESEFTGVDFILGADTHERLREPIVGKHSKVVECGAFGSFLGKLDLFVEGDQLVNYKYELLDVDPEKYKPDASLTTLVSQLYAPYKEDLQQVIGYTKTPLVRYFVLETPMDNLITDAIMWKFKPDIALSNGFRFCQPLAIPPQQNEVAITKEFLWDMLPVDSNAKRGLVTGKQIWEWLENELENAFARKPGKRFGGWFVRFSGMEVNFTIGKEKDKRLNWVKIGDKPLDLKKVYSIIACEREGDPDDTLCRIEHVKDPELLDSSLHTIIEEYLKENSPVAPVIENRATATDEPQTLLTQLRGYSYEFS